MKGTYNMTKMCYLILAYDDPDHLKRMIDCLNDNSVFYVHIDKKSEISPFEEILYEYENVHFIPKREKIYWGGYSIVQAELNLIRAALESDEDYLRFVLLSGSDYPIKDNAYIHTFFQENKNIEYIRAINLDKLENKNLFGIHIDRMQMHDYPFINQTNTYLFNRFRAGINFVLRLFPMPRKYRHQKFDLYHGSQWWALTEDCLKELLQKFEESPADYHNFKIGFASDEKFFHTLFFNSKYAINNQVNGPDKPILMLDRHKGDTSKQTSLLANIHLLDASMTKWFTVEDFPKIKASDKIFVRKVSSKHSRELLDKIDTEILFSNELQLKEGHL